MGSFETHYLFLEFISQLFSNADFKSRKGMEGRTRYGRKCTRFERHRAVASSSEMIEKRNALNRMISSKTSGKSNVSSQLLDKTGSTLI